MSMASFAGSHQTMPGRLQYRRKRLREVEARGEARFGPVRVVEPGQAGPVERAAGRVVREGAFLPGRAQPGSLRTKELAAQHVRLDRSVPTEGIVATEHTDEVARHAVPRRRREHADLPPHLGESVENLAAKG